MLSRQVFYEKFLLFRDESTRFFGFLLTSHLLHLQFSRYMHLRSSMFGHVNIYVRVLAEGLLSGR